MFVAVDEKGEDVMSDKICHRCNGKQQRRRGGRNVQLLNWVMNERRMLQNGEIQAPLYGMQTHKAYVFVIYP